MNPFRMLDFNQIRYTICVVYIFSVFGKKPAFQY